MSWNCHRIPQTSSWWRIKTYWVIPKIGNLSCVSRLNSSSKTRIRDRRASISSSQAKSPAPIGTSSLAITTLCLKIAAREIIKWPPNSSRRAWCPSAGNSASRPESSSHTNHQDSTTAKKDLNWTFRRILKHQQVSKKWSQRATWSFISWPVI